jgi:hypothetical protein
MIPDKVRWILDLSINLIDKKREFGLKKLVFFT